MIFTNQFNYQKPKGETSNLPSLTIPDQTMTIRELIERHVRGLPLDEGKIPIYNGEEDDLPDLRTLDLSEIAQLKQSNQEYIKEQEITYNKNESEKRKKAFDKLVEDQVQERLKKQYPEKPLPLEGAGGVDSK